MATFQLSRSNQWAALIVAIAYSALFSATAMTKGASVAGLLFTLFLFVLIPTFVAYVAWGVGRGSRRAASIAFHVTLALLLVAYAWLAVTAVGILKNKAVVSEQIEKIVKARDAKNDKMADRWMAAMMPIKSKEMFDWAKLHDVQECERRKQTLRTFLAAVKQCVAEFRANEAVADGELAAIPDHEGEAKRSIGRLAEVRKKQVDAFEAMMNSATKFGETLLGAIELLDDNRKLWTIVEGQISIDDERFEKQVQSALTRVQETAVELDRLSAELREAAKPPAAATPRNAVNSTRR